MTTKAIMEPSPRDEGDDGPPPVARVCNNQIPKVTSTARNTVATTVRVTIKAARATVVGATRMRATKATRAATAAAATTAATMR